MSSFNISRFLLRVRTFWTRDRLVPVLGVAALFLFGLLFSQYISTTFFGERPIVAETLIGSYRFEGSPNDIRALPDKMELDRRHLEEEKLRLLLNRERLERMRRDLELHRGRQHKHKKFIIKNDDGTHEIYLHEDGPKKEFILQNKRNEDIRIEVNGEVVKIERIEEQI